MRPRLAPALLLCAMPLAAQQPVHPAETFTIAEALSAPLPSGLVASPDGRRIAWIGYEEGRRNVWAAQAPAWSARRVTRYGADDGQELTDLTFSDDGMWLLYTRGGNSGGNYERTRPANPTSDPRGQEQAVWIVPFRGGAPRRLGSGRGPVPSPAGDRVVWLYNDTLYAGPLRVAGPPRPIVRLRGESAAPTWSPDGSRLAFVSRRGDHAFIGVLDVARGSVTWLAPSTRRDDLPRWSPDGGRIAFIRRPGGLYPLGPRAPSGADPAPPPFTIMVADAVTGRAYPAYRSPAGPDGNFPGTAGGWGLMWAGSDRLVFANEHTGFLGLSSVPVGGGQAVRLTPPDCEIHDGPVAVSGDSIYYGANCGDVDRRHLFRVPARGGAVEPLTGGPGIEWSPRPVEGGVALLRSDAVRPAAPAFLAAVPGGGGGMPQELDGWPRPARFPIEQLVEPTPVVVRAADSLPIHLQVFAPADSGPRARRPAVMFFHGGPSRQMLLGWNYGAYYHHAYAFNQYLVSRGFVVVSVNYRGGIGYGRRFRESPRRGRFGASEYQDVLAAAAYLRSRPDVDSARIGLWGGSYGGYLTALGLARNSDLFAAGVDLHGVHEYAEEVGMSSRWGVSDSALALARRSSPVADIERWRSPVLLIQGDDDRNVEFQQTTDLARRLELRGVEFEELVLPDEVHSFLRHDSWVRAYEAGVNYFLIKLRGR